MGVPTVLHFVMFISLIHSARSGGNLPKEWTDITSEYVDMDLDDDILEIRSYIKVADVASEKVEMTFSDDGSSSIELQLSWKYSQQSSNSTTVYDIVVGQCNNAMNATIYSNTPKYNNKIWTVYIGELGLLLECNDEQILYYKFASNCTSLWDSVDQVKFTVDGTSAKQYRKSGWIPVRRNDDFTQNATTTPLTLKTLKVPGLVNFVMNTMPLSWNQRSNASNSDLSTIYIGGCINGNESLNASYYENTLAYRNSKVDIFKTYDTLEIDYNNKNVYWYKYQANTGYSPAQCAKYFNVTSDYSTASKEYGRRSATKTRRKRDSNPDADEVMFYANDNITVAYKDSGWALANGSEWISHSLDTVPLDLRVSTNGTAGTDDSGLVIYAYFFLVVGNKDQPNNETVEYIIKKDDEATYMTNAGPLLIYTTKNATHRFGSMMLMYCEASPTVFTTNLSVEYMKVWTFYKNSTTYTVDINGEQVIQYAYDDSSPDDSSVNVTTCKSHFSPETTKFSVVDWQKVNTYQEFSASQYFYRNAACNKYEVAHGSVSPPLPVASGTKLYINCDDGYSLAGDTTVTCGGGRNYTWEYIQPICLTYNEPDFEDNLKKLTDVKQLKDVADVSSLVDEDFSTCVTLNEATTSVTIPLSCVGACRVEYVIMYVSNNSFDASSTAQLPLEISGDTLGDLCTNSSVSSNTTCEQETFLPKQVNIALTTNTSSNNSVMLCEVVIVGMEAGDYTCPAGYYNNGSDCDKCPAGTYYTGAVEGGVTQCTKCSKNTYNSNTGSTTASDCKACDIMSYSSGGSDVCTQCVNSDTNSQCFGGGGSSQQVIKDANNVTMTVWEKTDVSGLFSYNATSDFSLTLTTENMAQTYTLLTYSKDLVDNTYYSASKLIIIIGISTVPGRRKRNEDYNREKRSTSVFTVSFGASSTCTDEKLVNGTLNYYEYKCTGTTSGQQLNLTVNSLPDDGLKITKILLLGQNFTNIQAPAGWYNEGTELRKCNTGSYSTGGLVSACTACPLQTYQNDTGKAECLNCESGTYTTDTGAAACIKCEAGSSEQYCGTQENVCNAELEESTVYGNYSWTKTVVKSSVKRACFYNAEQFAVKNCSESGFLETDFKDCKSGLSIDIQAISQEKVTEDNQEVIAEKISNVTEEADHMSSDDIVDTSSILLNIINNTESITDETATDLIKTVDNINTFGQIKEIQSKEGVADSVRDATKSIIADIAKSSDTKSILGETVGVSVADSSSGSNILALAGKPNSVGGSRVEADKTDTFFQAKVPASEERNVTAVYYQNDKLFPSDAVSGDNNTNKFIAIRDTINNATDESKGALLIVATVTADINYIGIDGPVLLDEDIEMKFKVQKVEDDLIETRRKTQVSTILKCSFYNESVHKWSDAGCNTSYELDSKGGHNVNCSCNHLTSFAVIMSFSTESSQAETTVTLLLLSISLVCLILTLVAYLPNKEQMKLRSVRINMMLVLSLIFAIIMFFIMDIVVTVAPDKRKDAPWYCIAVAFFMNYFWLCQLLWMNMEAVIMYLALIKVFNSHISSYFLKFNIICWVGAAIFPLIGLVWGGKKYANPRTCFIREPYAYVSFYGPVVLGTVANFVLYVFVAEVILSKKANPAQVSSDKDGTLQQKVRQLKAAASTACLLGLGWLFGFFLILEGPNYNKVNAVLKWLFIILNCSQGICLFIYYVLLATRARNFLLRYLKLKEISISSSIRSRVFTKSTLATRRSTMASASSSSNGTNLYQLHPRSPHLSMSRPQHLSMSRPQKLNMSRPQSSMARLQPNIPKSTFSGSYVARNPIMSTPQPIESRSQPSKPKLQPSESRSQPSKSISQPIESTSQPSKSRSQPSKPALQPSDSRSQPSKSRSRPIESTSQPRKSRSKPHKSRSHPRKSRSQPSKSTAQPSKSRSHPSKSTSPPRKSKSKPSKSRSHPNEPKSRPSESRSKPRKSAAQPIESMAQPSKSRTKPNESTAQPSKSRSHPNEPKSQPSKSRSKPSKSAAQPIECTPQPSKSRTKPSKSTSQPSKSRSHPNEPKSQPSESRSKPSKSTAQPNESTSQPSKSRSKPNESTSQPSKSRSKSSKSAAQPTESTAKPNESIAQSSNKS